MTPVFCCGKMGFTLVGKFILLNRKGFSVSMSPWLVLDAYFGLACLFDSRLSFCVVHVEVLAASLDRNVYCILGWIGDMPLLF